MPAHHSPHRPGSFYQRLIIRALICVILLPCASYGQEKKVNGQSFAPYKRSLFKPHKGLNYSLYIAPVLTVDPLGIGGIPTYALSVGSQIRLWESKTDANALQGLKVKGWYTAVGYEYYPERFDNLYASLWFRVKSFMPLAARVDGLYSFGHEGRGLAVRYCFGIEVKGISLLACGVYTKFRVGDWGWHPSIDSPYSWAGAVTVVIPVFNHFPSDR